MAKKSTSKKVAGKVGKPSGVRKAPPAKSAEAPSRGAGASPTPPPAPKVPPKSPLSKAELREFRQMLLDKRRSLVGDMNGMQSEALRTNRQDSSGDLSLMPDHPANIASDNFEQEFTLGLLQSERTLLTEIDEALARIDEGTYGVCLGTGEPISKSRLQARPWAKYCIEYARLVEKGLVRVGEEDEGDDADEDEPETKKPDADAEAEGPEEFEDEPVDTEGEE